MKCKDINGKWWDDTELFTLKDIETMARCGNEWDKAYLEEAIDKARDFAKDKAMEQDTLDDLHWVLEYHGVVFNADNELITLTDEVED